MKAVVLLALLAIVAFSAVDGARLARLQKVNSLAQNGTWSVPTDAQAEKLRQAAQATLNAQKLGGVSAPSIPASLNAQAQIEAALAAQFAQAIGKHPVTVIFPTLPAPAPAPAAAAAGPAVAFKVPDFNATAKAHDELRDAVAAAKIAKLKAERLTDLKTSEEATVKHFQSAEEIKMRKEGTWEAHVAAIAKAAAEKKAAEEKAAAEAKENASLQAAKEASDKLHAENAPIEQAALDEIKTQDGKLGDLFRAETPVQGDASAKHSGAVAAAEQVKGQIVAAKANFEKEQTDLKGHAEELTLTLAETPKTNTTVAARAILTEQVAEANKAVSASKHKFAKEMKALHVEYKKNVATAATELARFQTSQRSILAATHAVDVLKVAYYKSILEHQHAEIKVYLAPFDAILAKYDAANERAKFLQFEHDRIKAVFDNVLAGIQGRLTEAEKVETQSKAAIDAYEADVKEKAALEPAATLKLKL